MLCGVDLNRNYGFHFGESSEDTRECSDTYRGPTAFSEPETRAVRDLIEEEETIASAMNFHCYGNIWIHPFNYMKEKHKYPENTYAEIIRFYESFKYEVNKVSKSEYGNAIETVGYATDGEGSDWMLGEHKIIAFSPELGSFNPLAQTFFLPKDLIFPVIQENYKVIDLFLRRNNFEMEDMSYGITNENEFFVNFRNKGLANIFNPVVKLSALKKRFISSVQGIKVREEDGTFTSLALEAKEGKTLSFTVDRLNRLNYFNFKLEMENSTVLQRNIEFTMELYMADGTLLSTTQITFENEQLSKFMLFNIISLTTISLLMLIMFITSLSKQKRWFSPRNTAEEGSVGKA